MMKMREIVESTHKMPISSLSVSTTPPVPKEV